MTILTFQSFDNSENFPFWQLQRQSWRIATSETLITILTIENINSDNLCDLAIKSDAGQHSQFLGCFSVTMMISSIHFRFTQDMLPYWYNQMIGHKLGRTFQVRLNFIMMRVVNYEYDYDEHDNDWIQEDQLLSSSSP